MLLCAEALWLAMPITEFLVTIYAAIRMRRATAVLPEKDED